MANFHLQCTYIEIKVPKIEILSEILEEKDIDNQMFTILGLEEPLFRLKYSDFSCVIVLYFLSFFYTEGRIALFTSELVESGLIMLQKNRAGHGQGQGYKF